MPTYPRYTVGGNRTDSHGERMRGKIHQNEEEYLHRADYDRSVRHQPRVHLVPKP